ncbi:MAG: NlpC/P60 family protein [Ferruginibacter sp.]|nr:NlpC/P60 family protein [Ferruginibacter sp.]
MRSILSVIILSSTLIIISCNSSRKVSPGKPEEANAAEIRSTVVIKNKVAARVINTKNISANEVVNFAETLQGIKYTYGSTVKEKGFDCSGLINYVFNHFKISVPRTSVDFTNAGKEVSIKDARRGDLILFTGSDPRSGVVGHMGIITENNKGQIQFIHAASGPGVMISGMNAYFVPRFVKVNRVFSVL